MRGLILADHSLSGITSRASIIFSLRLQQAEWNNNNYIDAQVTITPLLTCVTLTHQRIARPVFDTHTNWLNMQNSMMCLFPISRGGREFGRFLLLRKMRNSWKNDFKILNIYNKLSHELLTNRTDTRSIRLRRHYCINNCCVDALFGI